MFINDQPALYAAVAALRPALRRVLGEALLAPQQMESPGRSSSSSSSSGRQQQQVASSAPSGAGSAAFSGGGGSGHRALAFSPCPPTNDGAPHALNVIRAILEGLRVRTTDGRTD